MRRCVVKDGTDRLRRAGPWRTRGPAGRRADRRPRRDDHAGTGRGPLPSHLFQRRRAGRSRHQVSGRVRHDPGGVQRPAGARMRLHGGAQRRQPAQHRRLAQEGDRGRPDPRPAAGRQRPRDLRRGRTDGLEPRPPEARDGGPDPLDQRARRGPQGRPQAGQGRRRVDQDLSRPATPPRPTPPIITRSA